MITNKNLSFVGVAALCLFVAATVAQCPNDPNCAFCMGSQCVQCTASILVNGTCQLPVNSVAGCVTYANDGTCSQCADGYYPTNTTTTTNGNNNSGNNINNITNFCVANPVTNCATYSLAGGCSACFGNVRALNNKCNPNGLNCTVKHCEICGTNGVCQGCGRGYVFETTNSTCLNYKAGYYGCLRVTNGICSACRYGFYSRNGICVGSSVINYHQTSNPNVLNGTAVNSVLNNNVFYANNSAVRNLLGLALAALTALFLN